MKRGSPPTVQPEPPTIHPAPPEINRLLPGTRAYSILGQNRVFMKPKQLLNKKTPGFLTAAALLLLTLGCTRLKLNPFPPFPYPTSVQHPFQTYLDSILALSEVTDSEFVTQVAINLNDPMGNIKLEGTGQAEVGYAFRSSVPGAITQLGVYLPTPGFSHTVTIWDSASGEVLAQTNVATPAAGGWGYTGLFEIGQGLTIQASHGYIIGFNSVAVGVPENTDTVANEMWLFNGIYDFRQTPNPPPGGISMLPFTYGSITFEGWYQVDYDTPISAPIFLGTHEIQSSVVIAMLGACDIGFVHQ